MVQNILPKLTFPLHHFLHLDKSMTAAVKTTEEFEVLFQVGNLIILMSVHFSSCVMHVNAHIIKSTVCLRSHMYFYASPNCNLLCGFFLISL